VRRRAVALLALAGTAAAGFLIVRSLVGVDTHGARIERYSIASRYVHASLPQTVAVPAGRSVGRPLLVFLHGRTTDGNESNVNGAFFAALDGLGDRAPIVVFPNGGLQSYWHNRRDGAWADYVMREVIPAAVRRLHADPRRVAIGGISMGGFGAYDIARSSPGRFCAVGGHSAAMWRTGGETPAGAFDDAEDFARNDVIDAARRRPSGYEGTPLWLDVGERDPFRSADTVLAQALRAGAAPIRFLVWPGAHTSDYWRRHWRDYLGFYASALARCRR
jgi:S-formylglutathione hydrolase FrmB